MLKEMKKSFKKRKEEFTRTCFTDCKYEEISEFSFINSVVNKTVSTVGRVIMSNLPLFRILVTRFADVKLGSLGRCTAKHSIGRHLCKSKHQGEQHRLAGQKRRRGQRSSQSLVYATTRIDRELCVDVDS